MNAIENVLPSVRRILPGLLVALLVGMAAAFLGSHYKGSMLLFALLLGMAMNFLAHDARCNPGIQFASGTVLRVGVALLGLRLTLENVAALGWPTLAALVVAVAVTVLAGLAFARVLRIDASFGVLAGGATAICGASAALAIASVLPRRDGLERDTSVTIIGVTSLSTIAMIVYPTLTHWLGWDALTAGIFIGATIHDVAQVVGAGYSLSTAAGDAATVTKLMRVAMLMPLLVVIALWLRRGAGEGARRAPLLPWFAVAFAILMLVNSTGVVPEAVRSGATQASQVCLVVAIAGVGVKTSLGDVVRLGWRPVALLVVLTLLLGVLGAAYLHVAR